jgi:Protein of unknown function (DUF2917)
MQASWIEKVLPMPSGSAFRLSNAKATTLKVQSGLVWITEEGVDEDCFLQIGEHYAVRGDGLVIVSAESDARIGIADHSNQVESIGAFLHTFLKIAGNTQAKRSW